MSIVTHDGCGKSLLCYSAFLAQLMRPVRPIGEWEDRLPTHGTDVVLPAKEQYGGKGAEDIKGLCDALRESPVGAVITCPEASIVFVNDALTRMTGYSADELVGRPVSLIGGLTPEERKSIAETLGSGGTWQGEALCTRKNGESFRVSSFMSAVLDSELRVVYFLGLHADITGFKRRASTSSPRGPETGETLLSNREIEVVRLLALGRTNREIGDKLGISKRTVDRHVSNILCKLGAANRAAAVLLGERAGLILQSRRLPQVEQR